MRGPGPRAGAGAGAEQGRRGETPYRILLLIVALLGARALIASCRGVSRERKEGEGETNERRRDKREGRERERQRERENL